MPWTSTGATRRSNNKTYKVGILCVIRTMTDERVFVVMSLVERQDGTWTESPKEAYHTMEEGMDALEDMYGQGRVVPLPVFGDTDD